jgi:hypothetical protein
MNRKDLFSLMEAYNDVVLDKEFEPEEDLEQGDGEEISLGHTAEFPEDDLEQHTEEQPEEFNVSSEDIKDNEIEKRKMVEAHLHTLRSHSHEIFTCIENGANIEPWMEEKIAIANDYIVHVANAIMYRK